MATENAEALTAGERRFADIDAKYFKLESICNTAAGLCIMGVMFLGVVQVIGRSVFNYPVRGYVDLVEIAMTIFAFLGISYCQKLGGHIRMEIIIGRFKGRTFFLTEVMGTLAVMFIVSILMFYGWQHFMRAWTIGDSTMDIDIVLWPSKLLVPFAFAMLLIRLSIQLVGFIRLARNPNAVHIGVPEIATVEETAQHEIDAGLAGEEEKIDIAGGAKAGAE